MDSQRKFEFKWAVYEQLARVGNALASPARLQILDLLSQAERNVGSLAREAGLPVANVSQHLQVLLRARLIESRRRGRAAFYRIADGSVLRLWISLKDVGVERLPEVEHLVREYLSDRARLAPVSLEELRARLESDAVVLLDVRPQLEFESGHIPKARSIPLEELAQRLHEIPANTPVVAYCRGPFCVFADEAVAMLRAFGRQARRLDLGFSDWRARGWPVESCMANKEVPRK